MKKFLCFFLATIILVGMIGYMGYKYILPKDYPVFIESFDHGVITVQSDKAFGEDSKFELFCKYGEKVTININPERTESAYYNLQKLTKNGVDVTDDVKMLEYTFTVDGKTTILAYFSKSKGVLSGETVESEATLKVPEIFDYAENEYLGSANAYNIEDPCIIYDDVSGHYYCFASDNVVMRSDDLLNWERRTNYFKIPEGSDNKEIMDFSQFESVKKWSKTHKYTDELSSSTLNNDRSPQSPDIIKYGSTYYLYFSLTKEVNSSESAIFCVKTNDLASAVETASWEDAGMVINSCGTNSSAAESYKYDVVNAAQPSVFTSDDGSKLYMAYGSFFGREVIKGSIRLVELDPHTGLLLDDSEINERGEKIGSMHGKKSNNSGVVIANPGRIPTLTKDDGSLISSCDVAYNSDTGYYYLFMTYGVSDTNFEIRVARSKDVSGPYLDMNNDDVASYGKNSSNDMYSKGLLVASGYNFSMSSGGGVSYTDIGRASIGSPSIIKLQSGEWLMISQSRAYYKIDGSIYCGEAVAEENDYDAQTASALDIRQLYFQFDWPMAMPEQYDGEILGNDFTKKILYGNWDVLIFDGAEPQPAYDSVSRYTSQKLSLFGNCAISEKMIDKGSDLSNNTFTKNSASKYTVTIDGVTYRVFPTIVWDNELDRESIVLTGFGDDGSTIWAKKAFSPYMGIYLETFEYLVSIAPDNLANKYRKKLDSISDNPTQETIDQYCLSLQKAILKAEDNKQ